MELPPHQAACEVAPTGDYPQHKYGTYVKHIATHIQVVPTNWIDFKKNVMSWPPGSQCHKEIRWRTKPGAKWKQFKLKKVKAYGGNVHAH